MGQADTFNYPKGLLLDFGQRGVIRTLREVRSLIRKPYIHSWARKRESYGLRRREVRECQALAWQKKGWPSRGTLPRFRGD